MWNMWQSFSVETKTIVEKGKSLRLFLGYNLANMLLVHEVQESTRGPFNWLTLDGSFFFISMAFDPLTNLVQN